MDLQLPRATARRTRGRGQAPALRTERRSREKTSAVTLAKEAATIPTLSTEAVTLVAADRRWIPTSIVRPDKLAAHLRVALAHDWDNRTYNEGMSWVLRLMDEGDEGWWIWWIIERPIQDRPRPALVGFTGFKGPPTAGGNVELLYNIAPSCRRRGLASQSTRLLLSWAFRNPKVRRVILTIDPRNTASCAVARSCGFSRREHECDEYMLVFAVERGSAHAGVASKARLRTA